MSSAFRRAEERRKAEREAARREAAREAALERAREEKREAEREEERRQEARAAARTEAEAERKRTERAAARRAALRAAAVQARAAERRDVERRRLVRERARAVDRAEARDAERRQAARAERFEASREQEREKEREEERRQERREQSRAEARRQQRQEVARAAAVERAREDRRRAERDDERRQQTVERARQAARAERLEAERGEKQDQRHEAELENERDEERREQGRAEARRQQEQEAALERARDERRRAEREEERRAASRAAAREAAREARRAERRDEELSERRRAQRARRPVPRRLGSGALSGNLARLLVDGRFVVDETGARIVLRGVTARALERAEPQGESFARALDEADATLLAESGATAVVVPIAQDLALEGRGEAEAADYLAALDETIATAASAQLYTIIQLSLISSSLPTAPGPDRDSFSPPVPDPESIDLWGLLGKRYADESAVVFDLFRSPHTPLPGDMTAVLMPVLTWPIWMHWLLAMLGELRRARPDAVVVARGLEYGRDITRLPLRYADGTRVPNVVYAAALETDNVDPTLASLARLARRAPVAVSPWHAHPFGERAVESLGRRLAGAGLHWFADGWRDPEFLLAAIRDDRLELTTLGRAFRNALAQPPPANAALSPRIGPARARRPGAST